MPTVASMPKRSQISSPASDAVMIAGCAIFGGHRVAARRQLGVRRYRCLMNGKRTAQAPPFKAGGRSLAGEQETDGRRIARQWPRNTPRSTSSRCSAPSASHSSSVLSDRFSSAGRDATTAARTVPLRASEPTRRPGRTIPQTRAAPRRTPTRRICCSTALRFSPRE